VPYLDAAVAAAVAGIGDDAAAVAVADMVRSSTCTVGALHHRGGVYIRSADVFTDPGKEDAIIDQIAATLPAEFAACRGQTLGAGHGSLIADAGHGVRLRASKLVAGWVSVRAATACTMDSSVAKSRAEERARR
jgi:hypothetical protein